MTPNEFQIKVRDVAFYPNLGNNLVYVVMGLSGETAEAFEEYVTEGSLNGLKGELGDCLWYLSQICSELKIEFENICKYIEYKINYDKFNYLVICSGKISEITKKIMRDDNGIIIEDKKIKLILELKNYYSCIIDICKELNCTFEEIYTMNYEKLISRKQRNVLKGSGSNR